MQVVLLSLLLFTSLSAFASDKISSISCTPYFFIGKSETKYEIEVPAVQMPNYVKISKNKLKFNFKVLSQTDQNNKYMPLEIVMSSKKSPEKVSLVFQQNLVQDRERGAYLDIAVNLYTQKYKNHSAAIIKPGTPQEFTLFVGKNDLMAVTAMCEFE